jgi:hypothetical protein
LPLPRSRLAGVVNGLYFIIVFATKIAVGEWFAYVWMIFLLASTTACWVAARDTYARSREDHSTAIPR